MKVQAANLLFFAALSMMSSTSGAAKDNLRSKEQQTEEDDRRTMVEEDDLRFIDNPFESLDGEKPLKKQYIVKYKSPEALARSVDNKKRNMDPPVMYLKKYDIQVVTADSLDDLKELESDEDVLYVEPDPIRYLYESTPHRDLQGDEEVPYGINMVKALSVPDEFVSNRKVCIIDTGYDITHPDLPTENVGGDDNRGNEWDKDGNGHGTHVAGTIAAIGDNGYGVVGVNRSGLLGLHIIRIFGDNGRPIFGSTLISAAQQCVDAGSNIISMSLGGPIGNDFERDFFQDIFENQNVLVIAAAGNSGNTRFSYPASYPAVMSVAAIDENQNLASFSQRNNQVEISAPGVRVLSTRTGGGYVAYSGTSMACPHVAGVAALVWSHDTDLTSIEMRAVLRETAEDLGDPGRDNSYGYGLVRADRAYQLLNGEFTLAPTESPTPERECFDFADYENGAGDGCDWYERGFFNRCSIFGNSRPNAEGVTGNDACCVCGGGQYMLVGTPSAAPTSRPTAPTPAPTGNPTPSPTIAPTQCSDEPGWVNSFGNGCEWYGLWRCFLWGDNFENNGLVADEACCVCK